MFSWISIALGVVVVIIAGQDGAFTSPEGFIFTIPLGLGLLSLARDRQVVSLPTDHSLPDDLPEGPSEPPSNFD